MTNAKFYRFMEIKDNMLRTYFKQVLTNDDRFHILNYDVLIANAFRVETSEDKLGESVFMRVDGDFFTIFDADQVGKVKEYSWVREFEIKEQFSLDEIYNDNLRTRGYIISDEIRLHEFVKGELGGYYIHHIKDTYDNRRSNLEHMTPKKHGSYHNSKGRKYWWDRGTRCVKDEISLQELIDYLY